MPQWLNKQTVGWAAGTAVTLALLLYPASLVTLGIGAALGYGGRAWLEKTERSAPS